MRPRRTPTSTTVFRLAGGTEDNDLWVRQGDTDGDPWIESVWELDEDEIVAIAAGGTIELRVFGRGTPPVSLAVGASIEERRSRSAKPKPDGGRIHG
jgi:hypothetical protein